jgi:hypothetical protein
VLTHEPRHLRSWLIFDVRQKIIRSSTNNKNKMAVHHVTFTVPERDLGKSDVEFDVKKDRTKLGKLKVSKGTVVWVPKDYTYGYKLGWAEFAALLEKHGAKEE